MIGLSRAGKYMLKQLQEEEDAHFVILLGLVCAGAFLAKMINLPDIVGAFLTGLSVNAAVRDNPAKGKLEFFGNSFFIPIFFIVTGFLIDPVVFFRGLTDDFALITAIILALIAGKGIAAEIAGRAFKHRVAARLTIWSLTMPQVAATLAATLVAFKTLDPAGQRLIDGRILNTVFVLVLTTSILGPVLTQQFAPRMLEDEVHMKDSNLPFAKA